jgi:predicted RNase H-like HicB family nuclease
MVPVLLLKMAGVAACAASGTHTSADQRRIAPKFLAASRGWRLLKRLQTEDSEGPGLDCVKHAVIFEQARANWAAYVPDLPGCMTTGRTVEETKLNIRDAIHGRLQGLRQFGDPGPGTVQSGG